MTAGLGIPQGRPQRALGPPGNTGQGLEGGPRHTQHVCEGPDSPSPGAPCPAPWGSRSVWCPNPRFQSCARPMLPQIHSKDASSSLTRLPTCPTSRQCLRLPTTLLHPLHGLRPHCGLSWLRGEAAPLPRPHERGETSFSEPEPTWIPAPGFFLRRPGYWNQRSPHL